MKNRSDIQIFFAVQKALFLRELHMRFGTKRMGLFWTFFEPFFQVSIFALIKVFFFSRSNDNFDFAVFLVLSFTAFFMFKNILVRGLGAFTANKGLFVYKQVKPIDTMLARLLMEIFISGITILLFIMIGFYFNFDMNVESLGVVALTYVWLMVFAFSLSVFLAVLNSYTSSVVRVVNIVMTVLMYTSALFYTIDMLSPELQNILLINPLVHFMEMLHGAYFYTLDDKYVDYTYMALWTVIPLFSGLWFYIKLEQRIISL